MTRDAAAPEPAPTVSLERGFIAQHLLRVDALVMLAGAALLVVGLGLLALEGRAVYNLVAGPFSIDRTTLAELRGPDDGLQYYVTVQGDRITETGIEHLERKLDRATRQVQGERVLARYFALWMGSKVVVVKLPPEAESRTVTGVMVPMSPTVQERFISRVEAEKAGMKGLFLPFMIDATVNFPRRARLALAVLAAALLAAVLLLGRAVGRAVDPSRHGSLRRLARLGPPDEVLSTVDDDLLLGPAVQLGPLIITSRHLVALDWFGARLWRLDDLLWVYPRETRQALQLLPLRRYHLCLAEGQRIAEVSLAETDLQRVLELLSARLPWLIVGYDEEVALLWEVAPARLRERIDERKQIRQPGAPAS